MALDKEDAKLIADAITKQSRTSPTKPSTETKSTGPSSVDLVVDKFTKSVDPFSSALGVAGKGVSALSNAVNEGKDAWRDLSKSGAGFNNDIVGMTVAAAGTRLPLKDFAGVIKDNTDILGQLGGSVTRGAESFAKMSKSFFESGATDSLKQLGYTNKDLNEVLALQAITLRGKFKDDQQRDAVAIENASKLATEMDLMAKLTGKSREAQMEQMKKNQTDMQFEAAIRLKTQGMGAEEAAKFEANARMQLKDAQLRGSGDMFKEVFATGQIMSKEAAMQAAVNQEQAAATQKQAQASARGDENAANAANREAQRAAVADANDKTKLGMVALGAAGGAAGKALTDSMGAQITYTKSLEATAAENGYDLKTKKGLIQAQQKMEEEAKKAAAGQDKDGKQVDGATKAAVALENTTDKVRAGLITGLLTPLNDKVGPSLGKFANNLDSMNKNFGGSGKDTSRAIEDATKKGFEQGSSDKPTNRYERTAGPGGLLGIAEGIGGAASGVARVANTGIGAVNTAMEPKERQGGSMDMTGGMFENWGKGEMVELHGMEGVMRPQDIEKIVETSLGGAKKSLLGATSSAKGSIDISKISKDISTSVSSVSGGGSSTVKGPDMREMSSSMAKMDMNTDQKKVFDEMMSLSSQQSKEKLQSLMEEKSSAQLANIEAAKARDAIEERLEAEGKGIKDLVGVDKERFDKLTAQMNSSADAQDKAKDAIKAAERAEQNRLSLQKMGYDVGIKQEEEKVKIIEASSKKIKTDIVDALPIKEIATKQEKFQSQFTESQQKIIDDYKGYSEENRAVHAQAMQEGVKEDTETVKIIGDRISKMKADIGDRQATEEEQKALDNEAANKAMFEKQVESKKEMLDVMQNLGEYSAKRELELKQKATDTEVNTVINQSSRVEGKLIDNSDKSGAMKAVVAGSSPTATQGRGITADSFTLGPNGMPIAKPKSTAAAAPDKPAEKQASPGKKINPETGEEYTPVGDAKPADKSADKKGSSDKAATLDDVVKSLNALNTKMGQLISVNEDGHKASAKAAKSGGANLYNK